MALSVILTSSGREDLTAAVKLAPT